MTPTFEAKVVFPAINEHGKQVKEVKNFVFDAVNYTDAETIITKEMEVVPGEGFFIDKIVRSKLDEVYRTSDDDYWYKVRAAYLDVDDNSGTVKQTKLNILVSATSTNQASDHAEEYLSNMMVEINVEAVQITKVTDVLDQEETESQIPDKLNPVSEFEDK